MVKRDTNLWTHKGHRICFVMRPEGFVYGIWPPDADVDLRGVSTELGFAGALTATASWYETSLRKAVHSINHEEDQ